MSADEKAQNEYELDSRNDPVLPSIRRTVLLHRYTLAAFPALPLATPGLPPIVPLPIMTQSVFSPAPAPGAPTLVPFTAAATAHSYNCHLIPISGCPAGPTGPAGPIAAAVVPAGLIPAPSVIVKRQPKPYRCTHEGCSWSFTRPSDLRRHLRSHEKPLLLCPYRDLDGQCNKKSGGAFHRTDVLDRHMKLVHFRVGSGGSGSGGWCRVCDERFDSSRAFILHCPKCAECAINSQAAVNSSSALTTAPAEAACDAEGPG